MMNISIFMDIVGLFVRNDIICKEGMKIRAPTLAKVTDIQRIY